MNASVKVPSGTETPWHALSIQETAKQLDTDPAKGLNTAEAANRLAKYGPNRLPEGKKRGSFARFFTQLNNILVYVLLAAGFTKLMLGLWLDAGHHLWRGATEHCWASSRKAVPRKRSIPSATCCRRRRAPCAAARRV